MATVNQACASILEKATSSKLDFSIHQTPYSIHFSLRKKFSKNSKNTALDYSSPVTEPQDDRLRQELLNTRKEYDRLYNFYLFENEAKRKLEEDFSKVLETVANVENADANVKAIKAENKSLKERLENKSLEFKQLKVDYDNLNKDKNALAVALKAAKADTKEQAKDFEKKKTGFEKKFEELDRFKKMKLAEEREEKLRIRKELKKAKQKIKKESEQNATEKVKEIGKIEANDNIEGQSEQNICNEGDLDINTKNCASLSVEHDANSNEIKAEPTENTSGDIEIETAKAINEDDEAVDENSETFIGPRLPRVMTPEEVEEFRKELFAKYFPI